MSRILRRPMFRGGRVDSRGTGITTGLTDKPKRGLVDEPGGYAGYEDILAQTQFNQNRDRNKQFTYQSVLDRMNDYYNKLYTGGVNEDDLNNSMQLAPPMSTEEIAQSTFYEKNPKGFQEEFFKGTFDGTNYNKEMKNISKQFAKFNPGKPNPYIKPNVEILETETFDNNDNVTGNLPKELSDREKIKANTELFAEMLGKKKARIQDASNMALGFAGRAFEDEATTKSALGKFFADEAKRPSEAAKIDTAAGSAAINDYIAGKRSAEQTELFLQKLKLSQGSLADKYNEARKVETNKGKAFATALYNKEGKDLKQVNKIPESIDDIKQLGLNNGDIILAPNEVNGNKVLSVLQVIISSNGNVSTRKYFPDL